MKSCAECGPCLMKRIHFQAELAGTGNEFETVRRCMKRYSEIADPDACSADIATEIHTLAYSIIGCPDPYREMKIEADEIAGKFMSAADEFIEASENRFKAAVLVSIVGNIMDFGSGIAIDHPEQFGGVFRKLLAQGIGSDQTDELERLVDSSDTVLYAFDNCGESQFDKFLIREIRARGKRVVGVVRGQAILNDVTYEDAVRIGLIDELDRIVSTGGFHIGFPRIQADRGLVEEIGNAEIMIAKGMANYESLSDFGFPVPVAFLLRAKCGPVSKSLGVPVGTNTVRIKYP